VSGEGKTSVSCHLATSLARSGRKTLLVDCDLRRPAAHRLFGLAAEPGLSELLRGETTEEDVVQKTPIEDLDMIVAGVWDPKATRALAQGRIAGVFESLKKKYDLIIVDSSPVLPVVDAILVGKHVDGVLFSVLRDVSRLPMVYAAHQRMAALGALMLGAIVNGTSEACYGYQYSYRGPR
jgi:capsular exopolysaccharide synthesis family protein